MKQETYIIDGLSCASCVAHLEKVMNDNESVESVSVNLATEKMLVSYDDTVLSQDDILKLVQQAGYLAQLESNDLYEQFEVLNMSCASCAASIENRLAKIEGITHASVNYATQRLSIGYDHRMLSIDAISKVVSDLGYLLVEIDTVNDSRQIEKDKQLAILKRKVIVSTIFAIPLLYIAMAPMIPFVDLPTLSIIDMHEHSLNFALIQLLLLIPIVIAGQEFYRTGFKALYNKAPNMDSLIAIGTTSAIVFSLYSTIQIAGGDHMKAMHGLYYESAGVILTLILFGKFLESISKQRTSQAIKKLMELAPKTAILLIDGNHVEVPIHQIKIDDILVVKPGAKVPVDGIVVYGSSSIDESMLTGESMPCDKQNDDNVYAATVNQNGTIHMAAKRIGADTALAQIIKLVEDAQSTKAPIANLADQVSGVFVPVVIVIAIVSSLLWLLSGQTVAFSLMIFVSVLVIACPCALGLATPTAIMVGTGKGAEYGILIKSGPALEQTHKIDTVIFDKTGTLTQGKPVVTDFDVLDKEKHDYIVSIVAAAELQSQHPLAQAIVQYAQDLNLRIVQSTHFLSLSGMGIEATVENTHLLVGNERLMIERGVDVSAAKVTTQNFALQGKSLMYIALDDEYVGIVAIADTVKPNSERAIAKLKSLGINVMMLTGDNETTAKTIAKQVGIDHVVANVLPQDKSAVVQEQQKQGKVVAMVGDGINDAPALTVADIGIAIGTGTDVAIESAQIVLMHGDLMDVASAIKLSQSTMRTIKQNLFWAFAYNTAGIPIAAGMLYIFGGPLLNPMIAALAMSFSSVSVLLNALRLRTYRPYSIK